MSDQARQPFTDKVANALKPDSEKSTAEHMGDNIKGTADQVASKAQPESQKSITQKVVDTVTPSADHGGDGTSLVDKAKDTILRDHSNN